MLRKNKTNKTDRFKYFILPYFSSVLWLLVVYVMPVSYTHLDVYKRQEYPYFNIQMVIPEGLIELGLQVFVLSIKTLFV